MSSWGGWASSLAKTVTEKIDDEITKIATADTTPKLTGEGEDADLGEFTVLGFSNVKFTFRRIILVQLWTKEATYNVHVSFNHFRARG